METSIMASRAICAIERVRLLFCGIIPPNRLVSTPKNSSKLCRSLGSGAALLESGVYLVALCALGFCYDFSFKHFLIVSIR